MKNYLIASDPITFEDGRKAYEKFAAIPKDSVSKNKYGVNAVFVLQDARQQQEAYRDNITKLKKDAEKRGGFEKNINQLDVWLKEIYEACGIIFKQ